MYKISNKDALAWLPGLITLIVASGIQAATLPTSTEPNTASKARLVETYGKLPLTFEPNQGQTDKQVNFLSRGPGYNVFLTPTEAVLALRHSKAEELTTPVPSVQGRDKGKAAEKSEQLSILRMQVVGADPKSLVSGLERLPGKVNYFRGKAPQSWRTNIPTYANVKYEKVYPGVDLIYYGNRQQLEYDFVVAPGADPNIIALSFEGVDKLEVDVRGDLVLHTAGGQIRMAKPLIYQEMDGVRQAISGGYVLKDKHRVGFEVAAYEASKPLVIDPVLVYSTYLSGSGFERTFDIVVNADGNVYVTGMTNSPDFPTTAGAFQTTANNGNDAFVAKLDPTGSSLVYATYLGGSSEDFGIGITVDTADSVYVVGSTNSLDFPTANPFQPNLSGGFDAFVATLDPTGSSLVYATYLGGSDTESTNDSNHGIAVDAGANIYVTGFTQSPDFPTTIGAFQTTSSGGNVVFVAKINPANPPSTQLVYSTYLGGSGEEEGSGVAVDAGGNAYVTGFTGSPDFPTTIGAFQTTFNDNNDAFVAKINPANPPSTQLVYSTYLGGSGADSGTDITVDVHGNVYVTGRTGSLNFPTANPVQASHGGGNVNAFAAKLDPTGSSLVYATYLGGGNGDTGRGIAVDGGGNIYLTGVTLSANFPTTIGAFQTTSSGVGDAFVAKINPANPPATQFVYSTYLGGSDFDDAFGVAVDGSANAYVTGDTRSPDFPTTIGAFQTTSSGGGGDAFVAKIALVVPYNFNGFFPPVDNLPVLNEVNAGRAIPVKFSLGGDQGLDIFATGYPRSEQIVCDSTALVDGIEQTVTAGSSSLSYNPNTDQYNYVWKTEKAWANTCRQLVVKLNDNSVHRANFKFK